VDNETDLTNLIGCNIIDCDTIYKTVTIGHVVALNRHRKAFSSILLSLMHALLRFSWHFFYAQMLLFFFLHLLLLQTLL
jgi:hypothetical protein